MSHLTKQLAGAYDSVECVPAIGVKYCEDNIIGAQPMLDFWNNKISVDAPIVNDMHSTISIGDEVSINDDFNKEMNDMIEVDIINLFIRRGNG